MPAKLSRKWKLVDEICPIINTLNITAGSMLNETRRWTQGEIHYTMEIRSIPDEIRIRVKKSNTDDMSRRFTDDKYTETLYFNFLNDIGFFAIGDYKLFAPLSNICRYCDETRGITSRTLTRHNKTNQHKKSLQRLAIEISQTHILDKDCISNILSFL